MLEKWVKWITCFFCVSDILGAGCSGYSQVRTGDVIAAVNGVNVLGLPLSAVRPLLAGPVGTPARLSVLRPEGEAVLSLVRHEPPVQPAVQGGQLVTVPLHKLVVWDHGHAQQVATATSRNSMQTPQGFLDVTVVDVENLPVCYEVGWSITSLGTGTATPYVEASVKTCRLRTGSQTGKLSAAINNTLRLPVVDTSPLCIRVKNDDVGMGGNIIGEIKFPMQQIANDGFQQKGRFRITVVCHLGERIPTLQHLEEGDEVTGLKNRPSTVHLELSYRGRPYREMQAAEMQVDELKRVNNERIFLEEEHRHLLDERRRVEIEEKGLLERDSKEAQALAGAAVKKAQREAKVREEVYALSKTKLAEEREAWLLGKRSTEQIHLGAMPHKHEIFEEAPPVQSTQKHAESKAWWDILPAMPSMPTMPTMPTITMPKVDLTQESIQSDKRNLANVELVLDMDMAVVGDDEAFKREVEEDVMASLGPAAKKCRVSSIRAGSVIVDVHVQVEMAPGVHEKVKLLTCDSIPHPSEAVARNEGWCASEPVARNEGLHVLAHNGLSCRVVSIVSHYPKKGTPLLLAAAWARTLESLCPHRRAPQTLVSCSDCERWAGSGSDSASPSNGPHLPAHAW